MAKKLKSAKPKPVKKPKPKKPGQGGASTQDDEGPGGQHPTKPPGKP